MLSLPKVEDFKGKRLLSFSAHPDDEVGGAGGLLAMARAGGAELCLCLALDPAEPRFTTSEEQEREVRIGEFEETASLLGAKVSTLNLPRYPRVDLSTILPLVGEIRRFKPDIVLTLSDYENHPDHRLVAQLVREAIWHAGRAAFPERGTPFGAPILWQYEADNPMPHPTFLLDITEFIGEKRKLMSAYRSQLAKKDLASAGEGLSKFRGIMYHAGQYVEGFYVSACFYG